MAARNIEVLSFLLATWYLIQAATAINTLESTPDHINGELLACVGDKILLTCSRDIELGTTVTRWTVSSPISCDSIISHVANVSIDPCDPFMFQNVSEIAGAQPITILSSTAVAVASASISGAVIQCSTSRLAQVSVQIGPSITLCIPGQLAPPENIQVDLMANGIVQILWNRPSGVCAARNISYDVNLIPTDGGLIDEGIELLTTTETIVVFNLTPDRRYRALLTANNTDCSISSDTVAINFTATQNAATTTESPTTLVITGETTTQQNRLTSSGLPQSTIIIIVVLIVVVVIILMVTCISVIVVYFFYWRPKLLLKHSSTTDTNMELHAKSSEVDALVYDDPNSKIVSHMKAASGALYAQPDKTDKKSADSPGTYQDPASIQHETAPTGDVYAVTEKKQKKGPTEADLAQMYSVPDKSKGTGLTYASLNMPGGGGGSEASKRPALTEYATVIN